MSNLAEVARQLSSRSDFSPELYARLMQILTANDNVELSTTDQLALKKLATLLMEILKVNNLLPSEAESFVTLLGAALYGRLKFLWEIVAVDLADSEGVLRQLITAGNDRLLLLALKCLRNITVKMSMRDLSDNNLLVPSCLDFLLATAQHLPECLKSTDKQTILQYILPALVGIENILAGGMKIENLSQLGSILGLSKAFIGCGLPGYSICLPSVLNSDGRESVKIPAVLPHGSTVNKSVTKKRKPKLNKAARQKLKNEATNISTSSLDQSDSDDLIVSSSDEKGQSPTKAHLPMAIKSTGRSHLSSSETSDHSDSFDPQQKLKFLQTSVKTSALSILNLITKATEKKNLYGFWSGLVPDPGVNLNPKLPFSYDFLTALMKESSFKLRSAMLHALSAWISACRQFLLLAENSEKTVAFTPLSTSIANSIAEVVKSLLLAMMAERYNGVLTQILRTIANLGCSCNFGKVEVGLALKISLAVRPHLFHSDPDVRVAALTCYGVLVSNKLSDGEVQKILGHMDVSSQLSNLSLRNSTFPPVIGMCVELSVDSAVPLPVRLESMQLISAMFKAHPILMRQHYEDSLSFCLTILTKDPYDVKLHGLKILQELLNSLRSPMAFQNDCMLNSTNVTLEIWQKHILNSSEFLKFLNDGHCETVEPILTASACETLACLDAQTFDNLSDSQKTLVVKLFSSMLETDEVRVQTAVLKCAETISSYPYMRQKFNELNSLVKFLSRCGDSNSIAVLEGLSSTFTSLTDFLINHRGEANGNWLSLQQSLLREVISGCQKSVRLRPGSVLSVGKLLSDDTFFEICNPLDVQFAVEQIVQNILNNNNKVRCNACIASGLVFSNRKFIISYPGEIKWLIDTLLTVLIQKDNWKICRIVVESLGKFDVKPMGIEFAKLLQMLFDLLDITKMENLTFDNYRLTESLTDSTIRSLLKLICLCDQEDLMAVEKEFLTIYLKPFSYACDRYKSITFANLSNIGTSAHGDFSMFFSAIEQLQRLSHLRISTQMLAVMSEGL